MTDIPLRSLLEFALEAAWQAGRVSLGYFQTGLTVERKADRSPVTRADREAEEKLRVLIERHWPTHGILGEEFGAKQGTENLTWIIDPIDGTRSFVCGVPFYACLIALTQNDLPVLGVAYFPALNDMLYATRGGGCYWNGRRTRVSAVSRLADAVLLGSDVFTRTPMQPAWMRLCEATAMQRTWGDAYGYALVATGRADVMTDPVMNVWDCGPFQVILEEAGGTFTDWRGNATIYGGDSIATNGLLFDQVMRIVKSA